MKTYYTVLYGKLMTLIEEGPVPGCPSLLDLYEITNGVTSHYRIRKEILHETISAALRAEREVYERDLANAERNLISAQNQLKITKIQLKNLDEKIHAAEVGELLETK